MDHSGIGWATLSEEAERAISLYRPLFRHIGDGAVERELNRTLPDAAIALLKEAAFGAIRIPKEDGGGGVSLPTLFCLLIELSDADSNVTQALRPHFGFSEDVLNSRTKAFRQRWFERLAKGDIVGSAWTEVGDAKLQSFSTRVVRDRGELRLTGKKFYTTGSIFADWIDVGATDDDEKPIAVLVATTAPGVTILDDWDGFGQRLTASGTAIFSEVPVDDVDVIPSETRFKYSSAFYQLIHLATLAGIGRAATREIAEEVSKRRRVFSHGNASRPAEDPQILQIVGRARSAAYCAGAIVLQAAQSLQRIFDTYGNVALETQEELLHSA